MPQHVTSDTGSYACVHMAIPIHVPHEVVHTIGINLQYASASRTSKLYGHVHMVSGIRVYITLHE